MLSRIPLFVIGIVIITLSSLPVLASPVTGQFFGNTQVNAAVARVPLSSLPDASVAVPSLKKVATKSQIGLTVGSAPKALPKTATALTNLSNWGALQKVDKEVALSAQPLTSLSSKAMAIGYDLSSPVR